MKILDCTLRDGGYQTNWHFSAELVKKYFQAMESSGVEYLEIGFKFPKQDNTYGPYAYVDNNLIRSLNISEKFKLGIMINITDFSNKGQLNLELIKTILNEEIKIIKFVRIATLHSNIDLVNAATQFLSQKGYEIHVNLMQVSELNPNEIEMFCKKLDPQVDTLTIADTYGVLNPKDVSQLSKIIRNFSKLKIGLHAHDNCGLALANSLEAIDLAFEFIDSTVSGIGRAAGNLRTEFIMQFIDKSKPVNLKRFESLFNLSNIDFAKLNRNQSWGPNLLYFIGSQLRIHPNNLMSIVKEQSHIYSEVLPLFSFANQSFSGLPIDGKNLAKNNELNGGFLQTNILEEGFLANKKALLLGSGSFLEDYKSEIHNVLINSAKEDIVFSTNLEPLIDFKLVKYFIILDEKKFMFQYEKNPEYYDQMFKKLGQKIISPHNLNINNPESILQMFTFSDEDLDNYFEKSLHYSFLIFKFGNVLNVNLLGFDGFEKDMNRNELIQQCLNYFSDNKELGGRIFAGTPTRYDVPKKSFFA
jgi:4-hydroxy 2-oxovalerate aldolase